MTVTSKWVALHEVSDYLKKGWREVKLEGGLRDAALMVSPEEPASEPAKVECPNCGERIRRLGEHRGHDNEPDGPHFFWTCQPAQPEPVAAEMPDLQDALNDLWNAMGVPRLDVREISVSEAIIRKAIEAISTHAAQPAKQTAKEILDTGGEWRELTDREVELLMLATMPDLLEEDNKPGRDRLSRLVVKAHELLCRARKAEAQPAKVRMPKVRELLDHLDTEIGFSNKIDVLTQAAFAELDAAEGRHP